MSIDRRTPDLFPSVPFWAPPAQKHSDTSLDAAEQIKPDLNRLRALVLETLRRKGPRTDEELQELTGLNPSTERPRRIELVAMGLVVDSQNKRKTRSGRWAVIWEAL